MASHTPPTTTMSVSASSLFSPPGRTTVLAPHPLTAAHWHICSLAMVVAVDDIIKFTYLPRMVTTVIGCRIGCYQVLWTFCSRQPHRICIPWTFYIRMTSVLHLAMLQYIQLPGPWNLDDVVTDCHQDIVPSSRLPAGKTMSDLLAR